MSRVRVIALGAIAASDDAAALLAVRRLDAAAADVVEAGRPGPGLLDLFDTEAPVVLVDVTRSALAPGTVTTLPLDVLPGAALAGAQVSSHGFGPAEAIELARALGRAMPRGCFVGIEGERFEPGETLSDGVAAALDRYVDAIDSAIATWSDHATTNEGADRCTSQA